MWKKISILTLVLVSIAGFEIPDISELSHFKDVNEQPHRQEILRKNFPELFQVADKSTGKVPFIVGGNFATQGLIPHQVTLYVIVQGNSGWLCGGSLINETWVLTAAHCVYDPHQYILVIGGHINLNLVSSHLYREAVTDKKNIYVHQSYNDKTLRDDIALIKLPKAIPRGNAYIGTVALPRNNTSERFVGYNGTVSGFGRFSDSSNDTSTNLKYVNLPIITNDKCAEYYYPGTVQSTNICGGTTATASSCSGDSGGPFTVRINNVTTIVGVVSFGASSGCQKEFPAGFTRVTSYMPWIDSTMNASPRTIVVNILFIISAQIALIVWNF